MKFPIVFLSILLLLSAFAFASFANAQTSGKGNLIVAVNQYCVMDNGNWAWLPLGGVSVNLVGVGVKGTDVGGNAIFTNLQPDQYSITATLAGFYADAGAQPALVDVNANQTSTATLQLLPIGTDQCQTTNTSTTLSMSTTTLTSTSTTTTTSTTTVPEFPSALAILIVLLCIVGFAGRRHGIKPNR